MYIERELSLESEVRFVYPRKVVSVEEAMTKPAQTVQQVVEVKEKRGMELSPLISTNRKYSEDYQGQSPIEEQIRNLASLLNLDSSQALAYAKELLEPISEGEGWFAIISDSGLKKLFPNIEEDRRYFFGVELVHKKLAELHKPVNDWFSGDISPNNLRVHKRTKKAMGIIAKEQPGDILILSCQLGDRFPGFSPG